MFGVIVYTENPFLSMRFLCFYGL